MRSMRHNKGCYKCWFRVWGVLADDRVAGDGAAIRRLQQGAGPGAKRIQMAAVSVCVTRRSRDSFEIRTTEISQHVLIRSQGESARHCLSWLEQAGEHVRTGSGMF